MAESPSLRQLVEGATALLAEAGVNSPRVDAIALAEHALDAERLVLAMAPELPRGFPTAYAALVERRRRREPLQHITGTAAFRHLRLQARPGVFVPRPETEVVAQHAIDEALRLRRQGLDVLVVDLCCGTGAIALSVAQEVDGARVVAIDRSPEAVDLTGVNAAACGLAVLVAAGDVADPGLLADLVGRVDVVVSNPPYIPPDAVPVEEEVCDHDPDLALYGGGADGLDVPRAVVRSAARLLRPGGLFVMEHAEGQAAAVRADVATTERFTDVRTDIGRAHV